MRVPLKINAATLCPPPPPSGLKASDAYAQIMIKKNKKMLMQGICIRTKSRVCFYNLLEIFVFARIPQERARLSEFA
jgi:hypothetical protein